MLSQTHIQTYIYTGTYAHTHTYTYTGMYTHTHKHTDIHTLTHTHTHTQAHIHPQTYSGLEKNSKEKNQGPETTGLNILNEQLTFEQSKRWQSL